jgi:hypothetical protein
LKVKNINAELIKVLPHRTLESIKGVRRKTNKQYHDLLGKLRCDPSSVVDPNWQVESVRDGVPPKGVFDPGRNWIADDQSLHVDHDSWIAKVRNEVAQFEFLAGLDVGLIN